MEMESLPNGNSVAAVVAAAAAAAAAAPSSKLNQLAESLKLEHQFLRVPFEHFKKSIRANHRIVEKEMSAVISGVADAANADLSGDEAVHHLNSLVSRLQGLKRKVIGLLTLRLVPKKRGKWKKEKENYWVFMHVFLLVSSNSVRLNNEKFYEATNFDFFFLFSNILLATKRHIFKLSWIVNQIRGSDHLADLILALILIGK